MVQPNRSTTGTVAVTDKLSAVSAYILIKNKMIVIDIIGETAQQLSLYIECKMQLEMNFTYLNCNNSKTTKNINVKF